MTFFPKRNAELRRIPLPVELVRPFKALLIGSTASHSFVRLDRIETVDHNGIDIMPAEKG